MKRKRKLKKGVLVVFAILCIIVFSLDIYFIFNKKESNEYSNSNEDIKEDVKDTMNDNNLDEVDSDNEEVKDKKEEEKKTTTVPNGVTSKGFKIEEKNGVTYIDGLLVVNKTYSLPSSYNPGLDSKVNEKANEMFAAAKLEGLSIKIQSGFRSYNTQETLYNRYVKERGKEAADTFSARPGHSEHQSGLAFDVCESSGKYTDACINSNFDNTVEAKWLSENAYKYGFILRFVKGKTNETGYKYESWHFRYVGIDLASKLYNNGDWITLEDYFGIDSVYNK